MLKEEVENSLNENAEQTKNYMDQINGSLATAIKKNKEKEHEQLMDAVLSAWLALMFTKFEEDIYSSAQLGIDQADKQLKQKNITTITNKEITAETFEKQVTSRIDSVKNDLVTISEEIKSNSSDMFKSLNSVIDKKKREELSKQLLNILKANGITHFYDKAGRAWEIERYVKMRTLTELVQSQRMAFFTRATQFGVDLVRIIHLNINPHCELCIPFENKILSINGNTPGYMTIQDASLQGLFHPNCDHVPEQLELAPIDKGGEGEIKLNQANKKRADYNKKRNYQMF